MNRFRFLITTLLAVLLAGCAGDDYQEQVPTPAPDTGAAIRGSTPVGFSAYAQRGVTRAGYPGLLDMTALEEPSGSGGGFGVFAYYTDLKKYDQTYIPNFMYNQGVYKSGGDWAYTPVMYWPNESGSNAQSDDEDKVSFFAYAPYVPHLSAAAGSVSGDATWGITGFSRNTTEGDPIVKYMVSFDPSKSVDLCWAVCNQPTWGRIEGANQTMTEGLPWLDVEHPAAINQPMTFTFRHALSQLNVQIDADPDINIHDVTSEIATGTKVYVRSISFTGIATQGALNLNNTVANTPLWLEYSGTTDLPYGESVTVKDGRRDGREGASGAEATNETPAGLNPQIVQTAGGSPGVTHELQNLFNDATLTTPVYVIPTGEKVTVTIVYDVETTNPDLIGYISDGATHGISIENKISKDITWSNSATGLEAGKKYQLNLHLGLNSVKFDASVDAWDDSAISGQGWLPYNFAADPPVSLSLGSSITMPMTAGVGTPQTLTATTLPVGETVNWTNSNDAVATIATGVSSTRGMTRGTVSGASSIVITPVAAGTTIITATTSYGSAQCLVTVTDETTSEVSVTLTEETHSMYAGETYTLTATTTPAASPLTWVSSNEAAATVDPSTGLITAVNAGLTYITATTASGNSASCPVTILPTEVALDYTSMTLTMGNTQTLNATTTPLGRTVNWSSDATAVATVDASGLVHAVAVGTAHITATTAGGGTRTCTVTVIPSVASVTIAPAANTLTYTGAAQTLVTAGTASYGTMQYGIGTSGTPPGAYTGSIPTQTNAGTYYVWYYAQGTAGFTDSAADKVAVTIQKAAGNISFADATLIKTVGDANFAQTVNKTGDGTVTYTLSNSGSNATINSSTGEVTIGSAAGTATVTATVVDGSNYTYATTTRTYTLSILPKTSPDATVTPGNWGGSENTDLTPDRNGL